MSVKELFEALEKYENRYGLSIPIGAYMKIKEKFAREKPKNIFARKCPICKKETWHTYHGFRGHNYSEVCSVCGNLSYAENDIL
jgi:hypothetical protein